MELNELEKRQLFQVEGDCQTKVLDELYFTARYTSDPEQRNAAQNLLTKLRALSEKECMDLVFACMRGIGGGLKKDIYGSDKRYSFCFPPTEPGSRHVAFISFLERHPEIKRVNLYMDNDLAGRVGSRKIKAMLRADSWFRYIRVGINPPRIGKDYNEKLLRVREQIHDRRPQRRREQAAVSL